MANFNDPYGIGTGVGSYYSGALANDPRLPAINRNISGQIAPDVRNQISQAAAERGIGIGSYGGGNDQSSLLRALGLTSMDLTNKGLSQYGEAYNSVPALNPTSLFINPTDQAQMNLNRELQTQSLNSQASIQAANRELQARMQSNQLGSTESMFGRTQASAKDRFNQERADALSGFGKTDSMLQGIIDRNSGGGARGTGVTSPFSYGGGAQSDFAGDINNLWSLPTDDLYGYSGPAASEDLANANWTADYGQDYYAGEDAANAAYADFYNDW